MNVRVLQIRLGSYVVGLLVEYNIEGARRITRFLPDAAYVADDAAPVLSWAFKAATPAPQRAVWANVLDPLFNGRESSNRKHPSWLLPPFFQNLLPEGALRDVIARLRGCDPYDHFDMLAACGGDLPGNVYAQPIELSVSELMGIVTQKEDALEQTVTVEPMDEGVSVSGIQPKYGVMLEGGRYVARRRDGTTRFIAKLPVLGYPYLPEVEHVSLLLAAAAGVEVCKTWLAPLSQLMVEHRDAAGDAELTQHFLAVARYDRDESSRIHVEDFAQILGVMPEDKYSESYLQVAGVLLNAPDLGEPAVHELFRRLMVNELLGNPDMHLKNMGLRYRDGVTPEFPPAYDIVAHALYSPSQGHGLRFLPVEVSKALGIDPADKEFRQLTPRLVREFCGLLDMPEKPVQAVLRQCVMQARKTWPAMIAGAALPLQYKRRLYERLVAHRTVRSLDGRSGTEPLPDIDALLPVD